MQRRQALQVLGAGSVAEPFGVVRRLASEYEQRLNGDEFALGTVQFVEFKLETPEVETDSYATRLRSRGYYVDAERSILALNYASPSAVEGRDTVLTNGTTFAAAGTPIPPHETDRMLAQSVDYGGLGYRGVPLAKSVSLPAVRTRADGEQVTLSAKGRELSVRPGEEASVRLDRRTVEPRRSQNHGPQTVEPRLTARHRGSLSVYGGANVRVVPTTLDDEYAQFTVRGVTTHRPDMMRGLTDNDLLVLERGDA